MNWMDAVKEIRKAQENNQLVIFVGAGVSKNSNIPTWWELIKKIAEEINYDKCTSCKKQNKDCPISKCEDRYAFTQDEFLRIPEYYFHKDSSEDNTEYYKLIESTLKSDKGSNPINDEVFNILPHHIITTNYDSLLENTKVLNSQLYTIVSQDRDLLSKASERYLIKMHGDLEIPKTIVLKESDYINYEQEHTLISTFIRSLLVNHTFLFLGYSLNDYNLNLILGWINYFKKYHKVEERPFNFLVNADEPSDFEKLRLKNKSIHVVDLASLPEDLVEKASAPASLTNPIGKKLFSFLRCIMDSQILQNYILLADILAEKYQVLKSYKKISFYDLIQVQPLGRTELLGTELVFYDKKWYEDISMLIDEENSSLIDTFQRAGLTDISFYEDQSNKKIPSFAETSDEFFRLYLDNNYVELFNRIQACSDTDVKIYYYRFLEIGISKIEEVIAQENSSISNKDYIAILLHKMRVRTATITLTNRQSTKTKELEQLFDTVPIKYRKAITRLKTLFKSTSDDLIKMDELDKKQENKYRSNTSHSGHSFIHIWGLQAYAYDYYFFFKRNCIPLDYFIDPQNYFSYYVRAILCSYSPVVPDQHNEDLFFPTDRRHYPLNKVDIDILIKYTTLKSLRSWLKKYSVQFLEIESGIDIVYKYKKLCNSYVRFRVSRWINQIFRFSIIVCLLRMENNDKKDVLNALICMFVEVTKDTPSESEGLFETVDYLVKHLKTEDTRETKGVLLGTILAENIYPVIAKMHSSRLSSLVKELAQYEKEETKKLLVDGIEAIEDKSEKIKKIFLLRHILPMEQYVNFMDSNLELLNIECIFSLIIEKILPFSSNTLNIFVETIIKEDKSRKATPGLMTYPDRIAISIESCLILILIGFDVELTLLKPYAHYSEHLQFMLNPCGFNYSSIDTSNYMWQNLIYAKEYKEYFIEHKNDILSDNLKNLFDMGFETRDQQKIVYGLLLENDDLRSF